MDDADPTAPPGGADGSRRRELLNTAAARFRERGYAATTTRDLANDVNIQKATLYHHIRRKGDLLYDIIIDGQVRLGDAVAAALAPVSDPSERLRTLLRAHLETTLGNIDVYLTSLVEFKVLGDEQRAAVNEHRTAYRRRVGQVIGHAQDAGIIRTDISERYLALALINLLSWTITWYHPDGELSASELAAAYYEVFVGGARGPQH